ncbi:MAG: hypothetical protein WCR56_06320 [Bacilli bacterium]|jgi:methylenetetrahydrofolate dehydrogenase (NADP+)/methenyltetrahydrofolate cyclohydrolase
MILACKDIKPLLMERAKNDPDLNKLSFYLYSDKDSMPSFFYLKGIKKVLTDLNIPFTEGFLDKKAKPEDNLKAFKEATLGHFVILARPLGIDYENEFLSLIDPKYDPDMMTLINKGKLYSGDLNYLPATASGVREILKYFSLDISGKSCLVVGRSLTVGLPLAELVNQSNGALTLVHSHISPTLMNTYAKNADYIFLATGRPGLIARNSLSKNKVVIDCGYSKGGGDLGFLPEDNELKAYTPVPGGVGVLTSICLVLNALFLLK